MSTQAIKQFLYPKFGGRSDSIVSGTAEANGLTNTALNTEF